MIKKNKFLGFVMLLLLISSTSVFGLLEVAQEPIYWNEFISEGKFDLVGTLNTDYNKGEYTLNDGVQGVFKITLDLPQEYLVNIGFEDSIHNKIINCYDEPLPLSNDNGTVYGYCDLNSTAFDHVGPYIAFLNLSNGVDEIYYFDTITITHARFSNIMIATLLIAVLLGLIGLVTKEGLVFVPALLSLLGFVSDAVFTTYSYLFGIWGVGLVGIVFLMLVLIIKKLVDETMS